MQTFQTLFESLAQEQAVSTPLKDYLAQAFAEVAKVLGQPIAKANQGGVK